MSTTSSNDLLGTLVPEWQTLLQGWSLNGSLATAAQEALLLNGSPPPLLDLITQWSSGDFSALPPIVVLPSADINGAMGAYAISTGTIYLNADWLATANKDQVFAVLTEELGHHLDGILNAVDTPGDEGEYFSDLLRGVQLTDAQKAGLRTGSDSGTIAVGGSTLTVELASLNEFQVNQYTTGNQSDPYTLALGNGTFIIGWTSDGQDGSQTGVYARIYSSEGTPITAEFRVNTYTDSYQGYPRFADIGGGKFVATFGTWHNDQSGGIAAQIYNYEGTPVGSEFQVNTYTSSNQTWGEVAALKGGGFIVTWESYCQDGSELGIYAQRFNLDGSKNGFEFLVNNIIAGDQARPNVAALDDGGFIIIWTTDNGTGKTSYNVKARRYDAGGNALTDEFWVNSQTFGNTNNVPVARSNGAGGYIILWTDSSKGSGGPRILGKIYNSEGIALSGEISISEWTTGEVSAASLTVLPNGNFIAEWNSSNQDGSGLGIYAREFTPLGVPVGTEYLVNTTTAGNQGNPSVASNKIGDVMYAWHSDNSDGSGYGIVAGLAKGNSTPTDITASNSTFDENIAANTAIATFSTTDPDAGDTFKYSLVSGTGSSDNAAFTISGDQLLLNATPNYEAKSSYSIRVRTTDAGGLYTEKAINFGVNDVREVIRGNSLYTIINTSVNGSVPFYQTPDAGTVAYNWYFSAEAVAQSMGGNLATINDLSEQGYLGGAFGSISNEGFLIGLNDAGADNSYTWTSQQIVDLSQFDLHFSSTGSHLEDFVGVYLGNSMYGCWNDFGAYSGYLPALGIVEIPLSLSITRQGEVKEGSGLFTTSINLYAGTATLGNLAEGAQVWWKVDGITQDDLASGALTGTGTISNGKLDIQHSLNVDGDAGESFSVSVFSDAGLTQQIGTTSSVAVQEAHSVIRGNSLYTIANGPSWTQAEANSVEVGGHLVTIDNAYENSWIVSNFREYGRSLIADSTGTKVLFIGLTRADGTGLKIQGLGGYFDGWISGANSDYRPVYWGSGGAGDPDGTYTGMNWDIDPTLEGNWNDFPIWQHQGKGIAEVPITSSITRQGEVKEGAALFTTSINLSAGNAISGNLAEGAQVWWNITGITADDLASGALSGTGTVQNGKLDIQHSLNVDGDLGEKFEVSVFSDASMTSEYQIGSKSSVAISENILIRGDSIYTTVDGPFWSEAETSAAALGGHLTTISDKGENDFITASYQSEPSGSVDGLALYIGYTDKDSEKNWEWILPSGSNFTNWAPGEPNSGGSYIADAEDYAVIYPGTIKYGTAGLWNDLDQNPSLVSRGIAEIPFIRRGDSAYVLVQGPTWEEAEANAIKLGGHLVAINDAAENEWMTTNLSGKNLYYLASDGSDYFRDSYWTGFRRNANEFYWVDGTPFTYSNFGPGEPAFNGDYGEITLRAKGGWASQAGNWNDETNNPHYGIAEIKLAPNIEHAGIPTISGVFKFSQTISIDASAIQDGDNFAGYTPTYSYQWEISSDNGGSWIPIATPDATDGNNTYVLTGNEVGKQIRGVVKYLDGHGTFEAIPSSASFDIEYGAPNYSLDNILLITEAGTGTIDGIPFSGTNTFDLGLGSDTATIADTVGSDVQMTIEGGDGADTLNGNSHGNILVLTGINQGTLDGICFSGFENINLGAGNDTVYILPGGQLTGLLNGGGTGSTIIYLPPGVNPPGGGSGGGVSTPPTTPPTCPPIDLPPSQPPGIIVDGGYNQFVLNDNANTVTITGVGSGVVDGTTFINFYSIDLKGGDDTATIAAGGSLPGSLIGGDEYDTLNLNSGINTLSIDHTLSGTAEGTTIGGFEVINLLGGNDSALFSIKTTAPSPSGPRQSLTIDGGADNDALTLKLTKFELDQLHVFGTYSALAAYLVNPTGSCITLELSSLDLTLTGFESVSLYNSAPHGIHCSRDNADENTATTTPAAVLSSDDDDPDNTFSYTLVSGTGDEDNSAFMIVDNELHFNTSPDFESKTSYSVRLRTTDQGGLCYEQLFLFSINDLNEAPTDLILTSSGILENSVAGTVIDTLSAADPDAGSTFYYALVAGDGDTDNALVEIVGNEVRVKSGASINFETNPILNLRIQVTDNGAPGLTYTKAVTASVLNANEAPTDLILTSSGILENSVAGTVIGTLSAADPDAGSTFYYALVAGDGDTDNALVEIVGNEVRVKSGSSIDFETNPILNLRIQVTDNGAPGLTYTKAVTASVLNANEAPTDLIHTSSGILENSVAGTVIGTLSATDPDAGSTFSYALLAGDGDTDNALIEIVGNVVRVKSGSSIDFETNPILNLRIQVTDNGAPGLTYTKAVTASVLNANEAPTDILSSSTNFNENITAKTAVATFTTADPDIGNTFTYSLVAGTGATDNGAFTISGNQLLINASPNFELKASYSIRLRSTDQGGLFTEKVFTYGVNNLQEGPAQFNLKGDGTCNLTQTLTCSLAQADPDGLQTGSTYTYKWESSTTGTSSWTPLTGTTSTYALKSTDANKYVRCTVSYTDALGLPTSVITSTIHIVSGTTGSNSLVGGNGVDIEDGGGGNDNLRSGAGDDFVGGGSGDDVFAATNSDGNDYCDGGGGIDTVDFNLSTSGVTINLLTGKASSTSTGIDTLINIEKVIGSTYNDSITGNGSINTFTGGGGADTIAFLNMQTFGAASSDHILDFSADDKILISKSAFGITASTVTFTSASTAAAVSAALATTSLFVYESSSGNLYWNQNGNTSGAGTGGVFAVLDNKFLLAAANINLVA